MLPGHKILCLIPESGRFLFACILLAVVAGAEEPTPAPAPIHVAAADQPLIGKLLRIHN